MNVLNKVPNSMQPAMKADLREVWQAPDRATAETVREHETIDLPEIRPVVV
jgi:putative transposase